MKDKGMKKFVVGFQVTAERKQEIEKAANNYKVDNIDVALSVSQFVRVAVEKLLNEVKP